MLLVIGMNLDPQFVKLSDDLAAAGKAAGDAKLDGSDTQYERALEQLENAHSKFVSYERKSILGKLRRIAITHNSLAKALQANATADEVNSFLGDLVELKEAVEG